MPLYRVETENSVYELDTDAKRVRNVTDGTWHNVDHASADSGRLIVRYADNPMAFGFMSSPVKLVTEISNAAPTQASGQAADV